MSDLLCVAEFKAPSASLWLSKSESVSIEVNMLIRIG